jgi:anti-anti-sigma regulatory factor
VVIAVIEFLWDGWRPHSAVLGQVEGIRGFHDITRYPQARQVQGLVLFRWDAPLFFANAEFFRDRALDATAKAPTPAQWLVVAAEPVTSVDVTAADVLSDLNKTLRDAGIKLCFAELKDPVKDKLRRFGLFDQFGDDSFFATIGAAVDEFRLRSRVASQSEWDATRLRLTRAQRLHAGQRRQHFYCGAGIDDVVERREILIKQADAQFRSGSERWAFRRSFRENRGRQ